MSSLLSIHHRLACTLRSSGAVQPRGAGGAAHLLQYRPVRRVPRRGPAADAAAGPTAAGAQLSFRRLHHQTRLGGGETAAHEAAHLLRRVRETPRGVQR